MLEKGLGLSDGAQWNSSSQRWLDKGVETSQTKQCTCFRPTRAQLHLETWPGRSERLLVSLMCPWWSPFNQLQTLLIRRLVSYQLANMLIVLNVHWNSNHEFQFSSGPRQGSLPAHFHSDTNCSQRHQAHSESRWRDDVTAMRAAFRASGNDCFTSREITGAFCLVDDETHTVHILPIIDIFVWWFQTNQPVSEWVVLLNRTSGQKRPLEQRRKLIIETIQTEMVQIVSINHQSRCHLTSSNPLTPENTGIV